MQYGASASVAEAMIKMWENVSDGLSGGSKNRVKYCADYFGIFSGEPLQAGFLKIIV
ncbi:MAG: hypothetical protein JWR38_3008 [Mucilaginibacter sp.]|nr:hypothetical protein [Mucilaginibacter sp.]